MPFHLIFNLISCNFYIQLIEGSFVVMFICIDSEFKADYVIVDGTGNKYKYHMTCK